MKTIPGLTSSYWIAFILIYLFSILNLKGQETQEKNDSTGVKLSFILSEIPTEFTSLTNRLIEISDDIQPEEKILDNDSIVREYSVTFEAEKQEIKTSLPAMTYQRLERLVRAWYNYKNKFDVIQETLKERIKEIESVKDELDQDLQKWETISIELNQENIPDDFQQTADSAVAVLTVTLSKTTARSDTLLLMRSRQTQLILIIDDMIRMLEEEKKAFQSSYFILDSNPIWESADSVVRVQKVKPYFKSQITESHDNVSRYLDSNRVIVILQLIFIFLLILGFVIVRKIWPTEKLDSNSKRESQAGYIISRPFFSSLLISILISVFFYTNRPLVLGGFFVMLMMISTLVLLPGLVSNKLKMPLLLLLTLFIVNFLQDFLPYQSFANRLILLTQSLVILILIYFTHKIRTEFELRPRGNRFFAGFLKIFGLLMIIAFITNIIGSVKLSDFLISSTIRTLTFSATVITIVIILNSMMILLIKGKKAQSLPLYEQLRKLIDKRIRPLINWGGLILWGFGVLVYFRLLKPVQDLIDSIMDVKFVIASVAISIGGIISFFLIVLFTYIFVHFVKSIFKDEWVTKSSLPRGTADSISMLIRYAIVAFGIYLALGALGVSLNKFGFMAGALGVGIGFGLQNVVLNFIAGLILSFEKPIHVGDVIEVDQFMGKVTEIGVRASKVLTWDGSEVIVPNGLLITNKVVNWTLENQKRRLVISILTPFDADPEKVIEILTAVAQKHPNTLDQPAPMVLFNGYESSALDFTVYCWVEFNVSLSTKSDIAINSKKALAEAGIAAPIPVQKLQIDRDMGLGTQS